MSLKALNELRGMIDKSRHEYEQGNVSYVVGFNDIADAIEAEIAERYMELPVDADGVPIHVGDAVEFGENRNQGIVKALNERMVISMHVDCDYMNYAKYGLLWNADACRHVKPRTIEDVLLDAGVSRACVEDVAAEIRELMGGAE